MEGELRREVVVHQGLQELWLQIPRLDFSPRTSLRIDSFRVIILCQFGHVLINYFYNKVMMLLKNG